MSRPLQNSERSGIAAAIASGATPRVPPRGRGLLLSIAGRRQGTRLIDESGSLTSAGEYYYETAGLPPPNRRFNYGQEPVRNGARIQIRLHDGSLSTVRTWDNVNRRWRFTKLGQQYYKDSKDHYVVTFPVHTTLVRVNGSLFHVDSVLHSTAVGLGEIAVPSLMPDAEQLVEVRRQTAEFIASLSADREGEMVLIEGGGSEAHITLDVGGEIQYNKETISIQPEGGLVVSALLHRPLRASKPWSFGFRGVCQEAFDETEDKCVSHQLAALCKKILKMEEKDVEYLFDAIYHDLYPPGAEDNPYEIEVEDGSVERRSWREAGITVAMVQAFCNVHKVSVHVLWGELKVSSFTPSEAVSSLCLYVWGDHAFFVDDRNTKAAIAQMKTSKPVLRPEVVLKTIGKNEDPPTSEWLPWTGEAAEGAHHYYSEDLAHTRGQLHSCGLCPKVSLNGIGSLKALRTGEAVIHRLLPEAAVCEVFAEEFARLCKRPLVYKGQSIACFANEAFQELCKPPITRKKLTEAQYARI